MNIVIEKSSRDSALNVIRTVALSNKVSQISLTSQRWPPNNSTTINAETHTLAVRVRTTILILLRTDYVMFLVGQKIE